MPGFDTLLGTPQIAYLFPELDPNKSPFRAATSDPSAVKSAATAAAKNGANGGTVFVFQYWPSQTQDSYEVEYATKMIPGGSHPLYQWVSGSGRNLSFEAVFTAEVEDTNPTVGITALTPSARYTVNVAGAISKLKSYQLPSYKAQGVDPPQRLRLVFPNTGIGGNVDDILCFLKSARVTRESHFPSGVIRVATVALEFIETVQSPTTGGTGSAIQFIDRSSFQPPKADSYKFGGAAGI